MDHEDEFLKFMQSSKNLTAANRPMRLRIGLSGGVNDDMLLPQRVSGVERICGGIRYDIRCVATRADLPLKQWIAVPAELQFVTDRGQLRRVSGIITEAGAGNSDGGVATYRLVLRDAMAVMEKRVNSRVFRHMNEIDVVELLLGEWRRGQSVLSTSFEYEFDRFIGKHPRRETIMQHNESDAAFVDRLLRRRGISWFIRSGRSGDTNVAAGDDWPAHTLVLFSDANSLKRNAAGGVRFHRDSATEQRDTITTWSAVRSLRSGSVARHSWNYANVAGAGFMSTEAVSDLDHGWCAGRLVATLNDYLIEAPHVGDDHEDQMNMGRLRLSRHDYESKCFYAEGGVRDLNVGESFILEDHPEIDTHPVAEREFNITELQVEAQNNLPSGLAERVERLFAHNRWDQEGGALIDGQGKDRFGALRFRNRIACIRRGIPIVPAYDPRIDLPHPQPQSAIVVGPEGEEVHCDQYGRVQIRFPGMRAADHAHAGGVGAMDEAGASAWVRVASNWAGDGPGARQCGVVALPRAGSEVLVIFLAGDPDKPVIIGQMFHHQAPPPALSERGELPGNRYQSGIRSREVRGARANQLRFDDTGGQISAQLASDHGHSELNLGYLTGPRQRGAGQPRGEGAELRSDEWLALRAAKGVLISADAQPGDAGAQMARAELVGMAEVMHGVADALAKLAGAHGADEADGAHLAQLIGKLKQWDQGSNVDQGRLATPAGATQGGQPIIAASAPAGMVLASQDNLALGAQSKIDLVCVGNTEVSTGQNLFMRAARQIHLFAHRLGMKLIAASGDIVIQAHQGDIALTATGRIKLSAGQGIDLQAPEIKLVAKGAQADYGGGAITQQSSGAHAIKSSSFAHVRPGGGSPPDVTFPSTKLETDQRIMLFDPHTGLPVKGRRYTLRLEDGRAIEGVSDELGRTELVVGDAMGQIDITVYPEKGKA